MLAKTAKNEKCEYFKLYDWFFLYHFIAENEIKHLLLYLLFFDNNQYENNIQKTPGHIGPNGSSNSLYL